MPFGTGGSFAFRLAIYHLPADVRLFPRENQLREWRWCQLVLVEQEIVADHRFGILHRKTEAASVLGSVSLYIRFTFHILN